MSAAMTAADASPAPMKTYEMTVSQLGMTMALVPFGAVRR